LISNTAPYRRTLNPRKSNPVERGTIQGRGKVAVSGS
jgi:hypothetical protein